MRLGRLREIRSEVFLTQEELAAKSGVSVTTIRRIEAGEPTRIATARKLAQALGVTVTEMAGTAASTPAK